MTVYQSPILFLTEECRVQYRLPLVPKVMLCYHYFHNHCLHWIVKWWQKNNSWSFQRGMWDAPAYSPVFLKISVCQGLSHSILDCFDYFSNFLPTWLDTLGVPSSDRIPMTDWYCWDLLTLWSPSTELYHLVKVIWTKFFHHDNIRQS